jgi:glycosyltransferase involved in cell wall biosynthesis
LTFADKFGDEMIAAIVPAHNEADTIEACIKAVLRALCHPDLKNEESMVIVVADACDDATGSIARELGANVLATGARNVGIARREGARVAIELGARWLAFTDADTVVCPDWLVQQMACESDAVCGVVSVEDWSAHNNAVRRDFAATYRDADGHRHIHGANLGVSAAAYLRAGGFPPFETSEDVALVEALLANGEKVAWSAAARVVTSARVDFKAPEGFGATLLKRARQCAAPLLGETDIAELDEPAIAVAS